MANVLEAINKLKLKNRFTEGSNLSHSIYCANGF